MSDKTFEEAIKQLCEAFEKGTYSQPVIESRLEFDPFCEQSITIDSVKPAIGPKVVLEDFFITEEPPKRKQYSGDLVKTINAPLMILTHLSRNDLVAPDLGPEAEGFLVVSMSQDWEEYDHGGEYIDYAFTGGKWKKLVNSEELDFYMSSVSDFIQEVKFLDLEGFVMVDGKPIF